MSQNNRFNIVVLEDMSEKGSADEIEVMAETISDEAKQDRSGNLDEYDLSLDIPITLRKVFTTSLDSTTIPKNIHIALECSKWKTADKEEMRALEKNRT
ncbi:reverse transcriptase [Cucumis melo var. makuwa]|uniref:Reverse transcriptase n=1 Tax=Cucumis melo var. makuwa TaxID=1194695 RepID=A0A5A7UUD4_CUCMM|nr:reverse transcriptase [Cucumis melo var. makuwa]